MILKILEAALQKVHDLKEVLSFPDLIRKSRDILGIKQYRAAEFVKVSQQRLKNLETGYFRDMPTILELKALAEFYCLPYDLLVQKAKKHVQERLLERKIRIIRDEQEMYKVS
jgi:predicted transcriptional regulator